MSKILSKGIKVSYSTSSSGTWTELADVTTVPAMGGSIETVDVTSLSNSQRVKIPGLVEVDNLTFEFWYDNNSDQYKELYGKKDTELYWKVEIPGLTSSTAGVTFTFQGKPNVYLSGGEVGEALKCTLEVIASTEVTPTFPA